MPSTQQRPDLARDLGLSHAGAVVVGTIIGSGIFLVPAEMMQAVGSARLVYLAWMVGGVAASILISWLNYIGVRRAGEFQFVFTLLKVATILGIVAVGFSYNAGSWSNFSTAFIGAKGGIAGFFAALVAALWAYDGWNDLNMVAGEIRNPQRNVPLALIWGVATVGLLYILVNAAVQYALPATAVAASPRPA